MADTDDIIAMERAALDRWGRGDPHGYLEIMATDVTYFDPFQAARLSGLDALHELLVPLTGRIQVDRYDMVDPTVQRYGDAAVLTFNLVSYKRGPDGTDHPIVEWNSTEAYARIGGRWRIIHSHWSFVRPELKAPVAETS
jgi:ketosteroid isomerase-like protein